MKRFTFTLNNYEPEDIDTFSSIKGISCIGFAEEKGDSGTPHLQGWAVFKYPKNLKKDLIKIRPGTHWEVMGGTIQQSIDYCSGMCEKKGMVLNPTYIQIGKPFLFCQVLAFGQTYKLAHCILHAAP